MEASMRVARLVADLQPSLSDKADFLFFSRFDCSHDANVIQYVSRKFNVHHAVSKRRGVGWPSGSNDLFFGMLDWVYSHKEANVIPDYKAVLAFEGDSSPLHNNWINQLSDAWDKANTGSLYGPFVAQPPHINGNTLVSAEMNFLRWLSRDIGGCNPGGGWDFLLYPQFKLRGAKDAKEMRSWWHVPTIDAPTYEKLLSDGVCFLHGCKDDSVIRHVRNRFKV